MLDAFDNSSLNPMDEETSYLKVTKPSKIEAEVREIEELVRDEI